MTTKEIEAQIKEAEKAKEQAVADQDFDAACYCRDEIIRLKKLLDKVRLENDQR